MKPEPRRYLWAVDVDGAEIPGTRRDVSDWPKAEVDEAIADLQRKCGGGAHVVDVTQ